MTTRAETDPCFCGHSRGTHFRSKDTCMHSTEEETWACSCSAFRTAAVRKAADIDTDEFLGFIRSQNVEQLTREPRGCGWVFTWDLTAHWDDVEPKILHAKARRLIAKKKLEGCPCGCRGDFVVPELDRMDPNMTEEQFLANLRALQAKDPS